MRAALVLEHGERAVALDLEGVLAVADVERLDPEAAALGVAAEHPEQVAGPQPGLVAAGAALDLDDDVLVVVRVALDHRDADLLLELPEALARALQQLAQLGVVAVLGEELLRTGRVVGRAAPLLGQLGGGLEPVVLAPDLGEPAAIGDDLGVGHRARQLGEAGLDLVDERLDHCVRGYRRRGAIGCQRRRAPASSPHSPRAWRPRGVSGPEAAQPRQMPRGCADGAVAACEASGPDGARARAATVRAATRLQRSGSTGASFGV
jgi:hypothetical protein